MGCKGSVNSGFVVNLVVINRFDDLVKSLFNSKVKPDLPVSSFYGIYEHSSRLVYPDNFKLNLK